MKILVLGCNGQLGRCLNDQLKRTDHEVSYASREQIDIADFEVTKKQILEIFPDVVINATAYTAVDKAEEEQETANIINNLAVANIAKICNQLGCWLVHFSTDYVFDGKSITPYKEEDKTNPQGVYGETKLKGELAVQDSGCKYITIRTSWVFSEYGNNFLKTMLRLCLKNDELGIVDDQVGCPTYALDLAKAVVAILQRLNSIENIIGTYHFAGEVACSWADFAEDIFREAIKQDIIKIKPNINRITTSEFPTLAARPMYSHLDCSKFNGVFGANLSNYTYGIYLSLFGLKRLKYKKL